MTPTRKRWLYVAVIMVNVLAGMATSWYKVYLPGFAIEHGGNVLAACCIFFGLRFLFIRQRLWKVAAGAYLVCSIIELQQLYQSAWAVRLRSNYLIGIFLGHNFSYSDIIDYGIGTLLGYLIALTIEKMASGSD